MGREFEKMKQERGNSVKSKILKNCFLINYHIFDKNLQKIILFLFLLFNFNCFNIDANLYAFQFKSLTSS